jgi:hypothetical protein
MSPKATMIEPRCLRYALGTYQEDATDTFGSKPSHQDDVDSWLGEPWGFHLIYMVPLVLKPLKNKMKI